MKLHAFFGLIVSTNWNHVVDSVLMPRHLQADCSLETEVVEGSLIENHGGDSVFISANGKVVVTGDPAVVLVYDENSKRWDERASDTFPDPIIDAAQALSADGTILAARFNSTAGEVVRVVQYSGHQTDMWNAVGDPISTGPASIDLKLSADGTILVVSTDNTLQAFQWQVSTRTWEKRGDDISGSQSGLENLALSDDGNIVAFHGGSATILVYEFDQGQWTQLGQQLTGGTDFGHAITLSGDGHRVAITEASYSTEPPPGLVQVFEITQNRMWERVGQVIEGQSGDNAGSSVALSEDGSVLVVGANGNSGRVRVYTFDESSNEWELRDTITVQHTNGRSRFGSAVALTPDASFLASNSLFNGAAVHVYSLNFVCPTLSPTSSLPPVSPTQVPTTSVPATWVPSSLPENQDASTMGVYLGIGGAILFLAIAGFAAWKLHRKHVPDPKVENEVGETVTDNLTFQPSQSYTTSSVSSPPPTVRTQSEANGDHVSVNRASLPTHKDQCRSIADRMREIPTTHSSPPPNLHEQAEVTPNDEPVYLPYLPSNKDQCRTILGTSEEIPIADAVPADFAPIAHAQVHVNRGVDP